MVDTGILKVGRSPMTAFLKQDASGRTLVKTGWMQAMNTLSGVITL